MCSLFDIGYTPEELDDAVVGAWERWSLKEPVLAGFDGPRDAAWYASPVRDAALGALLRIASRDGEDDDLAAVVLCHRLRPALRRTARCYARFGDDAAQAAVGSLWEAIKTFRPDRGTRAYGPWLIGELRLRTLRYLTPAKHAHDRMQLVQFGDLNVLDAVLRRTEDEVADDPGADLVDFLRWAHARGALGEADLQLLRDLVTAGYAAQDGDTPWNARGVASEAAREWLARRTDQSPRTIRRKVDSAIHRLQAASQQYLSEVA
jgi:DNA-directed RNA polymerase specialized sigma24 family protein